MGVPPSSAQSTQFSAGVTILRAGLAADLKTNAMNECHLYDLAFTFAQLQFKFTKVYQVNFKCGQFQYSMKIGTI